MSENMEQKCQRFQKALDIFIERVEKDKWIQAVVLIGEISPQTIWSKEHLFLWVIEVDGVTKRRKSDGGDERLFRTYTEEDINIVIELIPRTRFKLMVEGNSRTAFTHNFFAKRILVHSKDSSIDRWFQQAHQLATSDQETSLMIATTWVIQPLKYIDQLIHTKKDIELARQELLGVAHSLAAIEIILRGEVYEHQPIYKAIDYNPQLFATVYQEILGRQRSMTKLKKALQAVREYLEQNHQHYLRPIIKFYQNKPHIVPLSQICDSFAHTQIYPWHIVCVCEWLCNKGFLEKISLPIRITKKSITDVEEPAYQVNK
ncbi:hypothetical protein [Candidatus Uabimicrobium sp. HlEnr_7]|uniref:hypothetical protein n=1 Tax=Candidatus Uabimicrobium helgolandensis TaxID=3095367 RepID=UPI003555E50B